VANRTPYQPAAFDAGQMGPSVQAGGDRCNQANLETRPDCRRQVRGDEEATVERSREKAGEEVVLAGEVDMNFAENRSCTRRSGTPAAQCRRKGARSGSRDAIKEASFSLLSIGFKQVCRPALFPLCTIEQRVEIAHHALGLHVRRVPMDQALRGPSRGSGGGIGGAHARPTSPDYFGTHWWTPGLSSRVSQMKPSGQSQFSWHA
jgi:hypothetical protein